MGWEKTARTSDTAEALDGSRVAAEVSGFVGFHRTERVRAAETPGVGGLASKVFERNGVCECQPFVLGPDGAYDVQLNRFFRELDGWGVRSENGRDAYTRDIMLFVRFLHESRGGTSIWRCDGDDLRAYKRARLRGGADHQVAVSTWRRAVAALDKWVQWARYERLLEGEPFRYVVKTVMTPHGLKPVRVNAEQEPDARSAPIRFVAFEDYLLWRNVGLRGELPDGTPDPTWRGRHGERNSLFADLLVYTGMRLGEAASLLVPEVPVLLGERTLGDLLISAAVAKRHRARTVYLNRRTLQNMHHYLGIERDELVQRARAGGLYPDQPDSLPVRRVGRRGLAFDGTAGSASYAKIGVADRRRPPPAAPGRLRRRDDRAAVGVALRAGAPDGEFGVASGLSPGQPTVRTVRHPG